MTFLSPLIFCSRFKIQNFKTIVVCKVGCRELRDLALHTVKSVISSYF